MNYFNRFLPVLIFLLTTQSANAYEPYKNAIQSLAEWSPVSPGFQGGDRSVFYIRQMDKRTLWNKVKYACIMIVEEAPVRDELLITYWPLPANQDWLNEEERFLGAFSRKSIFYPNYQVMVPRKSIPIFCEGYSKKIELQSNLIRSKKMTGLSPLEWEGLLCWGNSYFRVNSSTQRTIGTLDPEFRVYPTPLNQLIIGLLKTVVEDGLKRGAFKGSESSSGAAKGRSGQ